MRPLNVDGSLNLLGLETVRLIYFRNKTAGKSSGDIAVFCVPRRCRSVSLHVDQIRDRPIWIFLDGYRFNFFHQPFANVDFLELIFRARTAFAPSIHIVKMTQ